MANTYSFGTRIFCVTRAACGYVCRPVMVGVGGVAAAEMEADTLANRIELDVNSGRLIEASRTSPDVTDGAAVPENYRVLEVRFNKKESTFLIEKDGLLVREQTFADKDEAYGVIAQDMANRPSPS